MSLEMIAGIVGGSIVLLGVGAAIYRRMPKKLKADYYVTHWKQLQALLKDKKTWPEAVVRADKLLDRALKRRKYKGKSMGERMVAAQRVFTDNDDLWYAHNLCKKILADDSYKLKETDVKDALVGFRQALRDIGALPTSKETVSSDK